MGSRGVSPTAGGDSPAVEGGELQRDLEGNLRRKEAKCSVILGEISAGFRRESPVAGGGIEVGSLGDSPLEGSCSVVSSGISSG